MTSEGPFATLVGKIVAVHELLDSVNVAHQFGGAIALAWYRSPRATADIDLNVTVAPEDASPVLGALRHIGVTVKPKDRATVARDGQVRLEWDTAYLDLFFATLDLHDQMAERCQIVPFAGVELPILSAEHLTICKAVFNRSKDWVDIESMVAWGTAIDWDEVLSWIDRILGRDSEPYRKLVAIQ